MNKWSFVYPRPQLKRESFFSLNGKWFLNKKLIEVPFPREAKLSEYTGDLKERTLIYEKNFTLPLDFYKLTDLVIIHFGAVDQKCKVYLNEQLVTEHEGGYLDFEVDITKYLKKEENILKVVCEDGLDRFYPYGKQSEKSHGMWYTQVSGIWQSVWLEAVPKTYIKNININANEEKIVIDIDSNANYFGITIKLSTTKSFIKLYKTSHIEINFSEMGVEPHLWSLDDPYLYQVQVRAATDYVETYFAIRDIYIDSLGKLNLNNKTLTIKGVLDQGYYHDGLYLPDNPQVYSDDIMRLKQLGFNTIRKHIKLEPQLFYYACDKLGMLVMQDMVNSGDFNTFYHALLPTINIKINSDTLFVNKKRYDFFIEHSKGIIERVKSHPCIFAYTIYNEGWGQQKADKAYDTLKRLDPKRYFDSTSGWFKKELSDFDSYHIYFRNKVLTLNKKPLLLSECGGFKMKVKNHVYNKKGNYGYGKAKTSKKLTDMYEKMYKEMIYPSIENGMMGFIITQITDVENEINGLYTYDREVLKVDKERIVQLNNAI